MEEETTEQNEKETRTFLSSKLSKVTKVEVKTRAKITLDIFTNFILPAIDECTDLYSGIRFLL